MNQTSCVPIVNTSRGNINSASHQFIIFKSW
uniref:Uncharacterized protein n=1 Tax=Rhizophora mucronata TaxID=61149 RepID=A0A2P2QD98_RHIMU